MPREGTPRRGAGPRGRLCVVVLCGASAVVVALAAWHERDRFLVRFYEQRILQGRNPQGNLDAIARIAHPAAVRVLEKYALDPLPSLRSDQALRRLCADFPRSRFARAAREWESIVGHPYFARFAFHALERRRPLSPDAALALRAWMGRYPVHPGRDDAYLLLAVRLQESSPIESLRLLHEGFHEPDGDKRTLIANYFQRVLERFTTAEQLLAALGTDLANHLADDLLYAAALKKMRAHEFRTAVDLFERSVKARRTRCLEMQGDWPGSPSYSASQARARKARKSRGGGDRRSRRAVLDAIDGQIEICRWYLSRDEERARARDDETRAAILHEMGRRCFRTADDFLNRLYYEFPLKDAARRSPRLTLDDVHDGNHYRQAAEFFRRIVREHRSYSRIDGVAYSIPLCLWRLRRAWHVSLGSRLDEAIWRGFEAFARDFPRSSMADDALYIAGIHHWMASRAKEPEKIRENMLAIATKYPDGDVVQRYGDKNRWLKEAIEIAGDRKGGP